MCFAMLHGRKDFLLQRAESDAKKSHSFWHAICAKALWPQRSLHAAPAPHSSEHCKLLALPKHQDKLAVLNLCHTQLSRCKNATVTPTTALSREAHLQLCLARSHTKQVAAFSHSFLQLFPWWLAIFFSNLAMCVRCSSVRQSAY